MCECQPLQTQHFFIFLFASLKKWLFAIIFVTLCYSYSMEHHLSTLLLVMLSGCFGSKTQLRQNLSAESQRSDVLGARQLWMCLLHAVHVLLPDAAAAYRRRRCVHSRFY